MGLKNILVGLFLYLVPYLIFVVWGTVCQRVLFSRTRTWSPAGLAMSFILGCSSGSIILAPFFFMTGGRRTSVLLVLALFACVALVVRWAIQGRSGHILTRHDRQLGFSQQMVVLGLMLIFLVLCCIPLCNVGQELDQGYAFRWYFMPDYLKHCAITQEIAKCDYPPQNPYFAGERLHYYWLFYLVPAVSSLMTGAAREPLFLYHLLINICFLVVLWEALKSWAQNISAGLWGFMLVLFGMSFEGLYVLRLFAPEQKGLLAFVADYNIDAATRWLIAHPQIDGLYRAMIYTPQHLLSLALVIIVLLRLRSQERTNEINAFASLLEGVCVVLTFLLSSLVGAIVIIWYSLVKVILLFIHRAHFRATLLSTMIAAVPIGVGLLAAIGCEMVVPQGTPLIFVGLSVTKIMTIMFLNFGLMCVLGLPALFIRRIVIRTWPEIVLLVLATGLGLLVQIKGFPSDIGLKSGLLMIVCWLVLMVHFLDCVFSRLRSYLGRLALHLFLAVGLLCALPTLAIDIFNSQDTSNQKFTTIVDKNEMNACLWAMKNTPQNSVFQTDPSAREDYYSLLPTFAGRRVAVGDTMHGQIFQTPPADYRDRKAKVQLLLATQNPLMAQKIIAELGIDYILVGPAEKELFGNGIDKFYRNPHLFTSVFIQGNVAIFDVSSSSFSPLTLVSSAHNQATVTISCVNPDTEKSMNYAVTLERKRAKGSTIAPLVKEGSIAAGRAMQLEYNLEHDTLNQPGALTISLCTSFPEQMVLADADIQTPTVELDDPHTARESVIARYQTCRAAPAIYTVVADLKDLEPALPAQDQECVGITVRSLDRHVLLASRTFSMSELKMSGLTLDFQTNELGRTEITVSKSGSCPRFIDTVSVISDEGLWCSPSVVVEAPGGLTKTKAETPRQQ